MSTTLIQVSLADSNVLKGVCKQCIAKCPMDNLAVMQVSESHTIFMEHVKTCTCTSRSQNVGGFPSFLSHLTICRTTGTFPSLVWRRHSQRGRLCTSILHREEGGQAAGHLLVVPRVQHHLRTRDRHHSVGFSRQLPDDSHRGPQAQGHLHLQSIQCSRSSNRNSGSQC